MNKKKGEKMGEIQLVLCEDGQKVAKAKYKNGDFKSQGLKILSLFKANNWISTEYLSQNFAQYNARIFQLRRGEIDQHQYDIVSVRKDGLFGFEYRGRY